MPKKRFDLPDQWQPTQQIEDMFKRSLNSISKLINDILKEEDNPYTMVEKLNILVNSPAFEDHTKNISSKMVTMMNKRSYSTWRKAAAANTKGRSIYKGLEQELQAGMGAAINEQVLHNAGIIKTLPMNISEKISNYIKIETMKGNRASEIAKEIQKQFPKKSKANAKTIARTEVSKTQTALTKARAENLGANWYIWRTADDSRVRSSHDHMDDVLVRWNDPPSPEAINGDKHTFGRYHAGEIFNCRCYPEPVIDISMIKFPHKAHVNGKIVMISKKKFIELSAA